MQEVHVLQQLSCCYVVQYYGACLQVTPPLLVMEYMEVRLSSNNRAESLLRLSPSPAATC